MSSRSSADFRSQKPHDFAISMIEDSFYCHSDFLPFDDEIETPSFRFARAGDVGLSTAVMPALQIKGYGGSSPEPVYQVTRVNQESTLVIEGREPLRLAPDEFVIGSSHCHMTWTVARPHMTSTLYIAGSLFGEYFERPTHLVGRRPRLPFHLAEVLGQIMDASLAMSDVGRFGEVGDRLGRSFLNILALLPDKETPDERSHLGALDLRRHQIKTFINSNYENPELTIDLISSYFQISPRYIQMALAVEGICPSEYLKKCRLDAAARRLRAADAPEISITKIAFDCGFSSSAYFSTEFRRYSGLSPRDYRRRHQELAQAG